MAIDVVNLSKIIDKDVFTSQGLYCGKIRDIRVDLDKFKVNSIIIDAMRGSYLSRLIGEKKGVVIPFSAVMAVGDIILIRDIFRGLSQKEEASQSRESESVSIE